MVSKNWEESAVASGLEKDFGEIKSSLGGINGRLRVMEAAFPQQAKASLGAALDDRERRAGKRKATPLDLYFQGISAWLRAHALGKNIDPQAMLKDFGDDQLASREIIFKNATQPASTVTSGWMSELLGDALSEWTRVLQPRSVFAELRSRSLALDFVEGGQLRVPSSSATPTVNGSFVGEGQPIVVRRFGITSIPLPAKKLCVIVPISRELVLASPLNVPQIVKGEIAADTATAVDAVLLDSTAGDVIRPHGLRYNPFTSAPITGLTPSSATNFYERISADVSALVAAIMPSSRIAIVCSPLQIANLSLVMPAPALGAGFTLIASSNVTPGRVLAIDLDSLVNVASLPRFEISEEALLHYEDTLPLPIIGGSTQPPALTSVAAPSGSLFQTAVIGVKLEMPVNWTMRRSGAVSWMSVAW